MNTFVDCQIPDSGIFSVFDRRCEISTMRFTLGEFYLAFFYSLQFLIISNIFSLPYVVSFLFSVCRLNREIMTFANFPVFLATMKSHVVYHLYLLTVWISCVGLGYVPLYLLVPYIMHSTYLILTVKLDGVMREITFYKAMLAGWRCYVDNGQLFIAPPIQLPATLDNLDK